jgi:hypothetical protein
MFLVLLCHCLAWSTGNAFCCAIVADVVVASPAFVAFPDAGWIEHDHGAAMGTGVGIRLEVPW